MSVLSRSYDWHVQHYNGASSEEIGDLNWSPSEQRIFHCLVILWAIKQAEYRTNIYFSVKSWKGYINFGILDMRTTIYNLQTKEIHYVFLVNPLLIGACNRSLPPCTGGYLWNIHCRKILMDQLNHTSCMIGFRILLKIKVQNLSLLLSQDNSVDLQCVRPSFSCLCCSCPTAFDCFVEMIQGDWTWIRASASFWACAETWQWWLQRLDLGNLIFPHQEDWTTASASGLTMGLKISELPDRHLVTAG